jgi:hypothetical protein
MPIIDLKRKILMYLLICGNVMSPKQLGSQIQTATSAEGPLISTCGFAICRTNLLICPPLLTYSCCRLYSRVQRFLQLGYANPLMVA